MAVSYQELLPVTLFKPEVLRALKNNVGGLRNVVNNTGIIVGNEIRFPYGSTDGIAKEINPGSPVVPDPLIATRATAAITPYEASTQVFQQDLNASNSAAEIRAMAAEKVAGSAENRFAKTILDALAQYDTTEMELGDYQTPFDVDAMIELDVQATRHHWGSAGRYLLLPPQAKQALMKDEKFFKIWSIYQGERVTGNATKTSDNDNAINWVPYMGWNVAFMGVEGDNGALVGLPTAADTSVMGYAWLKNGVGFGMNSGVEVSVDRMPQLEGTPLLFKANSSCGAVIIDTNRVFGIKISPTYA